MQPILKSRPCGSAAARWGLAIISIPAWFVLMYYKLPKGEYSWIFWFIGLVALLLILQHSMKNRFWQWEFYDTYLIKKNMLGFKNLRIDYSNITSWQIRNRFGSYSGREEIPDYTEMAFWVEHKQGLAFNDLDFENYEEMEILFIEKMNEFEIEAAPYRD